jgi:hypothetical protein
MGLMAPPVRMILLIALQVRVKMVVLASSATTLLRVVVSLGLMVPHAKTISLIALPVHAQTEALALSVITLSNAIA